jgi:hypothetical protein
MDLAYIKAIYLRQVRLVSRCFYQGKKKESVLKKMELK